MSKDDMHKYEEVQIELKLIWFIWVEGCGSFHCNCFVLVGHGRSKLGKLGGVLSRCVAMTSSTWSYGVESSLLLEPHLVAIICSILSSIHQPLIPHHWTIIVAVAHIATTAHHYWIKMPILWWHFIPLLSVFRNQWETWHGWLCITSLNGVGLSWYCRYDLLWELRSEWGQLLILLPHHNHLVPDVHTCLLLCDFGVDVAPWNAHGKSKAMATITAILSHDCHLCHRGVASNNHI